MVSKLLIPVKSTDVNPETSQLKFVSAVKFSIPSNVVISSLIPAAEVRDKSVTACNEANSVVDKELC